MSEALRRGNYSRCGGSVNTEPPAQSFYDWRAVGIVTRHVGESTGKNYLPRLRAGGFLATLLAFFTGAFVATRSLLPGFAVFTATFDLLDPDVDDSITAIDELLSVQRILFVVAAAMRPVVMHQRAAQHEVRVD